MNSIKKNYCRLFLILSLVSLSILAQEPFKRRNPFSFPELPVKQEKNEQSDISEKELHLVKTETKWQVTTVLPSSVIVQHKEDGQIREIALSSTNTCS